MNSSQIQGRGEYFSLFPSRVEGKGFEKFEFWGGFLGRKGLKRSFVSSTIEISASVSFSEKNKRNNIDFLLIFGSQYLNVRKYPVEIFKIKT